MRFLSVHVEPSILARLIFWLHLGVVPLLESQDPPTRFAERRHPPNRAYLEGSLAVSAGGAAGRVGDARFQMTRVANPKPPNRAGGAPRLFCLPWRKLHEHGNGNGRPSHSSRARTFHQKGHLLAPWFPFGVFRPWGYPRASSNRACRRRSFDRRPARYGSTKSA